MAIYIFGLVFQILAILYSIFMIKEGKVGQIEVLKDSKTFTSTTCRESQMGTKSRAKRP